jgi:hypothetical protein
MTRKRPRTPLYLIGVAFPLCCLALLFDLRVPRSISTVVEVRPLQRWALTKGTEGQMIASVTDYQSATFNSIHVVQFERGESMEFRLVASVQSRTAISMGDTIGMISSSRLQERLAKLKGDLLTARADLVAKSTGEKLPLIEGDKKRVEYSKARIQEKKILFERAEDLFKKGYVSQEEFDAARWQLRQAELENEIDHAQLDVRMTGSKWEDLQVVRTAVQSYLGEIALLERRLQDFVLQSPISGEIVRNFSQDTLLIVNNCSRLILNVPVRYEEARHMHEGDSLHIALRCLPEELVGVVVGLAREVQTINGVQVMYARIGLDPGGYRLVPGLVVGGDIILPTVTLPEFISSLFHN